MATVGVVVTATTFFPFPILGGLLGALIGARALRAITRAPDRWGGADRARMAMFGGLLLGGVPALVLGAVKMDDWGPMPLVALGIYVMVVILASGVGGKQGAALAVGTPLAMLAVAGLVVLGVWFVIWLLITIGEGIFSGGST